MCVVVVDVHGKEVARKSEEKVKNQHTTKGAFDTKGHE